MLSIFLAMLVAVNGQDCLRANNPNGLPPFMDYRRSDLRSETIPELHQAIIPNYRFTCCGNITEWGVDVQPDGGRHDRVYTLSLQVWRPSPTVQTTGCYNIVGSNLFTSLSLVDHVAVVTPLPQVRIEFQPGDVLGFRLENPLSIRNETDGEVVLLIDSPVQGDNGYETEEVWHADVADAVISDVNCPLPVGSQPGRSLNTMKSAAPAISVSYSTVTCPPKIIPTSIPVPSEPTQTDTSQSDPPDTTSSDVTDRVFDQTETKAAETPPTHNIGLILGIIVTVAVPVMAIIITLAMVLGFARCMKLHKNAVSMATNEAYGTALQDTTVYMEGDTYDYPSMDDQAKSTTDNKAYATSAETKPCVAYATNAEAKPCVAYATNVTTERNDAYGSRLQDMVLYREGDTYDYPNMDN